MIEFITYYFLLFLYTQFSAFEKYRQKMTFSFVFILCLISLFVFGYTCFNIFNDPNYFFGINIPNKGARSIILFMFIGTFISVLFFFVSNYIRELSDRTRPKHGNKGTMGQRGEEGKKSDDCDPVKCKRTICNKKILNHISEIYSGLLQKKEGKKLTLNREIRNQFIKNKIKLLCRSTQLQKFISKKGNDKAYNYIRKIWTEWVKIIFKYKKGNQFIDTYYLTDNDFDNLIDKEDMIYSTFEQLDIPGTPSQGKESPFDEIKKYDMWYWGEPANTKIKIKYKCDFGNEGYLKFLKSNNLTNIWRSSNARQANINLCRGGKTEKTFVPFLKKGSTLIKGSDNISIYRAKTVETQDGVFKPLGDIIIKNDIDKHTKKGQDQILPKGAVNIDYTFNKEGDPTEYTTLITGDIKTPIDFRLVYRSLRNDGIGIGITGYSIWEPVAPEGYQCIGNVLDKTSTITPPNKNFFACVPSQCVRKIKPQKIWNNTDQHTPLSDCNTDKELENAEIDTDETEKYRNKLNFSMKNDKDEYRLFSTSNQFYELIPSGEPNSCFDKLNDIAENNSRWIVNEKNSEKYSIHSYFNHKSE